MSNYLVSPLGKPINVSKPLPSDITLKDVARGLAKEFRFSGRTRELYSVAQHSVLVARFLLEMGWPVNIVRAGLMHDASEAFLGDIIRPLKRLLPDYKVIENIWMAAIFERFDLLAHGWENPNVKEADVNAYECEVYYQIEDVTLYGFISRARLFDIVEPYLKLSPSQRFARHAWCPARAEKEFLALAKNLNIS